jgi:murein L,D-transpeptidase YafK
LKRALFALLAVLAVSLMWANWPMAALPATSKVTRLVVDKRSHELTVYAGDHVLTTYAVSLGRGGSGRKERQGDGRTPEGVYTLDARNPGSLFHRAFHVSYPSAADSAKARAKGLEPGGSIELHGLPDRLEGWAGCIG